MYVALPTELPVSREPKNLHAHIPDYTAITTYKYLSHPVIGVILYANSLSSFVVSPFCKILNWLIYGFVTRTARTPTISDVSKLESWLMAHFEATLMHITNNHFKTLFRAISGITGPKTPKIRCF